MSLLSSTSGTPERVWSLVNLLDAHEGVLARDEIVAWLSPPFLQGGQTRPISGEPDGQALGAATSLGLVRREAGNYRLEHPPARSYPAFADEVHDRLTGVDASDPDFVVLEAFAFVASEIERRQSTAWLGTSAQEFADAVEHAIGGVEEGTNERRFNSTKIAPWRRWIMLLGLGVELPGAIGFYPYVAERLLRELRRAGLPTGVALPAAELLAAVAKRMPYLDGGALFLDLCRRTGLRLPARRLTRLLSVALRDLHDEGALVLGVRGDASDLFELAPDGQHPVKTVQTITFAEGA